MQWQFSVSIQRSSLCILSAGGTHTHSTSPRTSNDTHTRHHARSVQCAVRTPQSYRHSAESAPTPSMHLLIVAACHLRAPVSTRPHHKCCMAQKPTSTNCFCDTVLFYLLLSQHPKAACRTGRSYSLSSMVATSRTWYSARPPLIIFV